MFSGVRHLEDRGKIRTLPTSKTKNETTFFFLLLYELRNIHNIMYVWKVYFGASESLLYIDSKKSFLKARKCQIWNGFVCLFCFQSETVHFISLSFPSPNHQKLGVVINHKYTEDCCQSIIHEMKTAWNHHAVTPQPFRELRTGPYIRGWANMLGSASQNIGCSTTTSHSMLHPATLTDHSLAIKKHLPTKDFNHPARPTQAPPTALFMICSVSTLILNGQCAQLFNQTTQYPLTILLLTIPIN